MQYTVILTKEPDLQWRAFVPGWPDCTAQAPTRDQALIEVKHKLAEAVSRSEIVRLEVPDDNLRFQPGSGASSEWSDYGIFCDDPTWGQLFVEIEKNRGDHVVEE